MSNPGFDDGASPPIRLRIAQALRVRTRFPLAAEVDHVPPLMLDPDWYVTMEIIGLEGFYRVVIIAVKGSEVKMLTNFALRARAQAYLGPPGESLVPTNLLSPSIADNIRERLSRLQFASGGGGDEAGFDGDVYFLTILSRTKEVKTALYFYQYPATAYRWVVPDGIDEPRWQAIRTVYEIWREILTNPVGVSP